MKGNVVNLRGAALLKRGSETGVRFVTLKRETVAVAVSLQTTVKHDPGEAERDGGPRRRSSLCPSGCRKDLRCGAARARPSLLPSLSPSALRRSVRKPWPSLHSLALYATRIAKLGAETPGRSSVRKVFLLRVSARLRDSRGKHHSDPGLVQRRTQQVLSRITLLHSPFKHFQVPFLDGDRILRRVAEPGPEKCDMVV